jgi:transposase
MTTATMAEQLVPDEVWAAIQPLLPAKRPHPKGDRPGIGDRAVLGGIIYVLRAGVPWRLLPAKELGCGSGVTCWRRLLPGLPTGPAASEHLAADRPAWDRVQHATGSSPLEGGAVAGLALANRRLTVRYERRADILTAFLQLAYALICARKLTLL